MTGAAFKPAHRHSGGRRRARLHEHLQADAKRDRDDLTVRGMRRDFPGVVLKLASGRALAAFCRPRIPLAGAQTPRALRAVRAGRAMGRAMAEGVALGVCDPVGYVREEPQR